MSRGIQRAGRTVRLWGLVPLLLLWPGGLVLAQGQPLPVEAQETNTGAVGPEAETNPSGGIQVFETPESSPAIQAADQQLRQRVTARLESDRWVLSYQVAVSVRGGAVTLAGYVADLLARTRAAEVAATVPGVRSVSNQIQVVTPWRRDQMLLDEVEGAFRHHLPLTSAPINVQVNAGKVILSGRVGSEVRKQLAGTLARSVSGVQGVENKLRVDHLAPRTDRDIQLDVESGIAWDPGLRDPQVAVQVRQGAVQLSGVVESESSKERVLRDAQVAGVKAVEASALKVLGQAPAAVGSAGSGEDTLAPSGPENGS